MAPTTPTLLIIYSTTVTAVRRDDLDDARGALRAWTVKYLGGLNGDIYPSVLTQLS